MKILLNILTLFGSVGLFIFGMRVMSEALQKAAGIGLRKKLSGLTRNKTSALLTGTVITGAIQSSTATSIMVVSFVNAGLLSLTASASLIMGANIGTTATAWLISIFGFKLNIHLITLPLIGIAFPFYYAKRKQLKYWSEFIIGFSLIFISLEFIKNVIPDINNNPGIVQMVNGFTNKGAFSEFLFIVFGFIITAVIQSSSVAATLTAVMCANGLIGFEHAAAMILGENLGTTITAFIASLVANKTAKRSAVFHILFNLAGILWAAPFLHIITKGIVNAMLFFNLDSPLTNSLSIPMALAVFHSFFNIANTLFLFAFTDKLLKLTYSIIPMDKDEIEKYELTYFKSSVLSTSELSIVQVSNEIKTYAANVLEMYRNLKSLFFEINEEDFQHKYENIKKSEKESDNTEQEIVQYLSRVSESDLSIESSLRIRTMLKLVDELESICDVQFNMAKNLKRKRKKKIWFTQEIRDNIRLMFNLLDESIEHMLNNLNGEYENADIERATALEKEMNRLRKDLHKKHMNKGSERDYKYEAGILYSDILNKCERLGDYIYNVSKTLNDIKNPI